MARARRSEDAVGALQRANEATDHAAMLLALLDAWRAHPHAAIAELVEVVGRRASEARPRPAQPRLLAENHAQWLEVAARNDPVDLDWLVANIVTGRGAISMQRVRALAALPPDPRFGPALLSMAERKPLTSRAYRPMWTAIFRILQQNAETRLGARLTTLVDRGRVTEFDAYLAAKLQALQRRVEKLHAIAPLAPAEAALIATLSGRLDLATAQTAKKTADDFLREIWQAPADDGLREVFADWLIEHGELRGELIVLQLARRRRAADTAASRRERALLDEHARSWMGPLEPVVQRTGWKFERGFLHSCTVMWRKLAAMPALMPHPAWSTVREYTLDAMGEQACDAWLDHMISLGATRR